MSRNPGEDFGSTLDRSVGRDNGTAVAAAEAYTPGSSADQRKHGAEALNQSLQASGLIPGVDIVGVVDDPNPNGSKIEVQIKPENAGTGINGQTNATYDSDSHVLEWRRDGVLPGNQGHEEVVNVNMVTGQETVTADLGNGNQRITTRAHVGDPANTTVNMNNGQVTSSESIGADGTKHTKEFRNNNGQLSVIQDGKALELPLGATVNNDPKKGNIGDVIYSKSRDGVQGPVQYNLHPDGSSSITMPGANGEAGKGRTFNIGADNKINYDVKPGDNLWNVAKDVAKLNGNANPNDQDIEGIVNQIGHAGKGGNADKINAGETIQFGQHTAEGDQQSLGRALPQERAYPNGVENKEGKLQLNGHELPNSRPDTEIKPGENGSVTYQDTNNHTVTVWRTGVSKTVDGKTEEYKQGENTISFNGTTWYAKRLPDGDKIRVSAPWNEGLSRGEIRAADGKNAYILGGQLAAGDNDGFHK